MYKVIINVTIVIITISVLSGCYSVPHKHIDGKSISANSGVLIVGLHVNKLHPFVTKPSITFNKIRKPKNHSIINTKKYTRLFFEKTDSYAVIELPAGNYVFHRLMLSSYITIDKTTFTIKPNKINYIGDIQANFYIDAKWWGPVYIGVKAKDRTAAAKNHMKTNYPKLYSSYPMSKYIIPVFR